MKNPIEAVIFDVGEVLVDWNPRYLYRTIFTLEDGSPDEDKVEWFLENVCHREWNIAQDAGRPFADAVDALKDQWPGYQDAAWAWLHRFQETISGEVAESVAALRHFKSTDMPIYGLTNFSAETFPGTQARFDFLQEFDGVVVSGEEKLIKPDPEIFKLISRRYDLAPDSTLFIDDSAANVASAEKMGFQCHHFKTGQGLLEDLKIRGFDIIVS